MILRKVQLFKMCNSTKLPFLKHSHSFKVEYD